MEKMMKGREEKFNSIEITDDLSKAFEKKFNIL